MRRGLLAEICGRHDPLFEEALEVVEQTLFENQEFEHDWRKLFRLEMAYLLLWSSIERYASLRYSLGGEPWSKVKRIADEPSFAEELGKHVKGIRSVFRTDRPDRSYKLRADDPQKSLEYYYQVRSNLTHRGKAANQDHLRLLHSGNELLAIFRRVLNAAFEESEEAGRLAKDSLT